jgi:hypothetical protein
VRALLLSFSLIAVACTESEEKIRDGDKQALVRMVEVDQRVSKAMGEADDLAMKGDTKGALDRIETKVKPDIAENDQKCASAELVRSAWGKTKKDDICAIVKSRKGELPRYEEAVKGTDKTKLAEALLAQAEIEKRALAMVAAFEQR